MRTLLLFYGLASLTPLVFTSCKKGSLQTQNESSEEELVGLLPPAISDEDFSAIAKLPMDDPRVELGRLLFFDKVISGNKNISCATCHHPLAGTGDSISLPVGQGGKGLAVSRKAQKIKERVPRNAPPLFNLGASEFTTLFWDGRVFADANHPAGFSTPAGNQLPMGLNSVLAAQAMFPVTSASEMAGYPGENQVGDKTAGENLSGPGGIWETLAKRLQKIPKYVELFKKSFPERISKAGDITFVDAANAIACFEASAFRADNSPFDQYLRGDKDALSPSALKGMKLFYGKAKCATCHSGKFQTDHQYHAKAIPQIGPGKGHGSSKKEDYGREGVTKNSTDRYKFRTMPLRNIELTAPYGHSGAYPDLKSIVRHLINPAKALEKYDASMAVLPSRKVKKLDAEDFAVQKDAQLCRKIAQRNTAPLLVLSDKEIEQLIAYLRSLTDPSSRELHKIVPEKVPSGIPVAE